MQKIIKRVTLLLAVALALVCMGIFASACSSKEFTITVYYSDGTTVVDGTDYYDGDGNKVNIEVQICVADGGCYAPIATIDENGVAKYSISDINEYFASYNAESYVIHLYAGRTPLNTEGGEVTVSNSKPSVKVVLSDITAP